MCHGKFWFSGGPLHAFASCLMASLSLHKYVSDEWERCATLRSRFREHRRLFQKAGYPDNHDPPCHVKEAALNHEVLKPLLYCMGKYTEEDGAIPLFTISQVEAEMLSIIMHLLCSLLNHLHVQSVYFFLDEGHLGKF